MTNHGLAEKLRTGDLFKAGPTFDSETVSGWLATAGWDRTEIETALAHIAKTFLDESKFDCSDNLRLARQSVPEEVDGYNMTKADGCCGEHDEVIVVERPNKTSSRIMVGFNFGH